VSYVYDAKGRLVQVVRAGSVNNGATTTYVLDKAGNRVSVTTTKP
jgi:YD repeat-containing protein